MPVPPPQPAKLALVAQRRSQRSAAKFCRVSPGYMSQVLNGRSIPSPRVVEALSELLGIPAAELFRPVDEARRSRHPGDLLGAVRGDAA